MERLKQFQTIEEAYGALASFYTEAIQGKIVRPDKVLTHVREFAEGGKFIISRYCSRIYVKVAEKDGTARGFGIGRDGLTDIFFTKRGKHEGITASNLDDEQMIRFKLAVKELIPWFFERYENTEPKPLPKKVQSLFRKLAVTVK